MDDTSILLAKIRKAKRVYIVGNGGSYANAVHMCNDLEECGVRAHALNPASLTRTANDKGYDYIFSNWILLHGEKGDLLIALSGSGKSKNIVCAMEAAKINGMQSHLVTDYLRTRDMQQSEEDQLVLGHELMRALR